MVCHLVIKNPGSFLFALWVQPFTLSETVPVWALLTVTEQAILDVALPDTPGSG